MPFADRSEAGRALAAELADHLVIEGEDAVVLALPRGGVPVGFEVAQTLGAPLDVIGVRKLGAPQQPELGVGAIAEGGVRVLDDRSLSFLGLDAAALRPIEEAEQEELRRRVEAYRQGRPFPDLSGRVVVVVDDGLATGITAQAACRAVRALEPARLILAAPVGAPETVRRLSGETDDVVCVETPEPFVAVGKWYRSFGQTSDDEVVQLLNEAISDAA